MTCLGVSKKKREERDDAEDDWLKMSLHLLLYLLTTF